MSGYTSGPLTADLNVVQWWGGEQPGCMVRKQVGNVGKPIANCLVLRPSNDVTESEAIANARLFAAAPDLLEQLLQARACFRTVLSVEQISPQGAWMIERLIRSLTEAIEKALA